MPLLLTAPSNTEALLHTALQLESARLSGTDTKCRHELLSAFPPVGPVLGSPLAFQTLLNDQDAGRYSPDGSNVLSAPTVEICEICPSLNCWLSRRSTRNNWQWEHSK